MLILKKLLRALTVSPQEKYLNGAQDLHDLEYRMKHVRLNQAKIVSQRGFYI